MTSTLGFPASIRPFSKADIARCLVPPERAATIPPRLYSDIGVFELERERLLKKSWVCLGHSSEIPNPGDYFTVDFCEEPLLVVRGKAGEIDVLSNVCIHRNFPVARGRGNCRLFKCQYHQWIYNLDGTLRGAALMGQAEDFRIHDWRLHAFRTKVWHGWIFVNLDPVAPPLAPQLTGLDDLFRRHQSETYQYINLGSYDLPVNWKCVVDIFAENYHTSGVHETSLKDSVPSSKTLIDNTDGHPYCVFRLPSGSGDALTNPDEYLLSGGFAVPKTLAPNDLTHAIGGIVYPTFSWYFNPDLFFYVEIHPQRHNRTTGRYGVAVIREALDDPQFAAKLEQYRKNSQIIVDEDLWAIGEMQRGKRSAFATQGRTSHIEGTLWHFHKWYVERLQAAAPELFA